LAWLEMVMEAAARSAVQLRRGRRSCELGQERCRWTGAVGCVGWVGARSRAPGDMCAVSECSDSGSVISRLLHLADSRVACAALVSKQPTAPPRATGEETEFHGRIAACPASVSLQITPECSGDVWRRRRRRRCWSLLSTGQQQGFRRCEARAGGPAGAAPTTSSCRCG